MWEIAIPAAVGAAVSMFNNKKNNDNNLKAIQLQFDNAVKMWNMQNEYNTPLNQSKRLKEAGLNPLLMYNNAAAGGTASAMANPVVTPNRSPLDGAVDNIAKLAQVLMTSEDIKGKKIANDNAVKTGYGIDLQNKLMEQQYGFNDKYNPLRIDSLRSDLDLKKVDLASKQLALDFQKASNPVRLDLLRLECRTAVATLDKLDAETRKLVFETALVGAKIKNINADTSLKYTQIRNVAADTALKHAQKRQIDVCIEKMQKVDIPKGQAEAAIAQLQAGFNKMIYDGGVNSRAYQMYLSDYDTRIEENLTRQSVSRGDRDVAHFFDPERNPYLSNVYNAVRSAGKMAGSVFSGIRLK